jgi:hypothetical protein
MKNLTLGFLLGIAASVSVSATAADRASDWILSIDRATASGAITRRLSYATHVDVPTSDWPSMRAAAATSSTALTGWMDEQGWSGWWLAFSQTEREGARAAILLGQ